MAKAQDVRPIIKLRSTAGTGYTYVTKTNRRNDPDRLVLKTYDPGVRKHVEFREEREAMAKKSMIAKNNQRKVIVERYAAKRLELKKALVDPNGTDESREAARLGLQKLPRNASPVRLRNRDAVDGRPRGHLSKFGISRVRFRDMAHKGELPGITKSSW